MTRQPVSSDAIVETRRRLSANIASGLNGDVATYLLSLHNTDPDFRLIGLPEATHLSAVRCKLVNLEMLKHQISYGISQTIRSHFANDSSGSRKSSVNAGNSSEHRIRFIRSDRV